MNTDIEWFEKHRQRAIDEFPVLKDARLGCHIWLFTTRMSWYHDNKQFGKFWQDAGFEPLSEASKRLVCVHGDLHRGNIICDNDEKIYLIDYEFVAPQWAVNDIAYIFSISQFGCHDYQGKFKFCKMYLEELGLPSDDEEVDLLIFDAECQRLRCFWPAMILGEMGKTKHDPEYDHKMYRLFEETEAMVRKDKSLIKKAAQTTFQALAEEINPKIYEACLKEAQERYDNSLASQVVKKRKNMTCEQEE